ncbi:hypothetical protein LZ30DRAFT_340100 [Colletotrichum cereale]|nr:hypothetical protein LZ30DRAFT_340100 [Colletotrichum cereale]
MVQPLDLASRTRMRSLSLGLCCEIKGGGAAGRVCQHHLAMFVASQRRASPVRFVLNNGSRFLSSRSGSAEPLQRQGSADKVPGRDRRSPHATFSPPSPPRKPGPTHTNASCQARSLHLGLLSSSQDAFPSPVPLTRAAEMARYGLRLPPDLWLVLGTCRLVSL